MTSNVPSGPVRLAGRPPHAEINKDVIPLYCFLNYWSIFEVHTHELTKHGGTNHIIIIIIIIKLYCHIQRVKVT